MYLLSAPRSDDLHQSVADTLGWIYLKENLSDKAVEMFKELVGKAPNHSTFRYHLGMALYQKGVPLNQGPAAPGAAPKSANARAS